MTRKAIDPSLFDAFGPHVRSFVKTATIGAPVEKVYESWTEGAAFVATYASSNADLSAEIDLAIGGSYEWLWDGVTGSNGCQILSYIPNRMISFSWNAPPSQPESRAKRTWVVVEFEAVDKGSTRLTLTHLGFGASAHWQETFDYFSAAWLHVLTQFKRTLADEEAGVRERQPPRTRE